MEQGEIEKSKGESGCVVERNSVRAEGEMDMGILEEVRAWVGPKVVGEVCFSWEGVRSRPDIKRRFD